MISIISLYVPYPHFYPICKSRSDIKCCDNLIEPLVPPPGNALKYLTYMNINAWADNWLTYMQAHPLHDDHYVSECLKLKETCNIYTSDEYFYFGYFPNTGGSGLYEPKYVTVCELLHSKRTLSVRLVAENPKFIDDDSLLIAFENDLRQLCDTSFVFFKYDELKRPGQMRYYYDWIFTD
jgi:hypothetical protein